MLKPYLEVGEIVTTHGVLGEVKIYPWCDGPEFLCALPRLYLAPGAKGYNVEEARPHKTTCLVRLEGVEGMDEARKLVGRTVWAARADMPLGEGRFFVQDLIGCQVRDAETGRVYGEIAGVTHPGANDVYEVKNEAGQSFLFPAVAEFLGDIRPEEGWVSVRPIPGMFDLGGEVTDEN